MGGEEIDDIWASMQQDAAPPIKKKSKSKKVARKEDAVVVPRPAKATVDQAEAVDEWEMLPGDSKNLQRDINTIGDGEASRVERHKSLENIYHQIQLATKGDPEKGQAIWDVCLKPLVKRLYDDVEKIRILALECLLECVFSIF